MKKNQQQRALDVSTGLFAGSALILVTLFVRYFLLALADASTGCGKTESTIPCRDFTGDVEVIYVVLTVAAIFVVVRMGVRLFYAKS